jgi:hypothetical protein
MDNSSLAVQPLQPGRGLFQEGLMGMRFVAFALALAGILASAFASLRSGNSDVIEIFGWLGAILVTSVVALWPFAGRDQRAELKLERPSWADRIDFREPPAVPRSAVSARGAPVDSRTSRAG